MKLLTLVFSSLSLLSVAAAVSPDALVSNAKRLAQGLPPQRPRRLYSPHLARDPTPSGVTAPPPPPPAPTAATTIRAVFGSQTAGSPPSHPLTGTTAGYLNNVGQIRQSPTDPFRTTTDHPEDAVAIYDPYFRAYGGNIAYYVLDNGFYNNPARNTAITLSPDTGDWLSLGVYSANTDQPAGSPPLELEPGSYAEARVWKIDPADGRMSLEYVNPDGTVAPGQVPVIFYCGAPGANTQYLVFVTSNVAKFRDEYVSQFPEDASCTATDLVFYFETS